MNGNLMWVWSALMPYLRLKKGRKVGRQEGGQWGSEEGRKRMTMIGEWGGGEEAEVVAVAAAVYRMLHAFSTRITGKGV